MGIWQLVCATDIKRVARSPGRVREVADTYFDAKVSMRTDLSLAERRSRLGQKYLELLRRVPAHTHAEVRAAQEAAVAKLDLLERGEGPTRPTSPATPQTPARPEPEAPHQAAPAGRSRLASPGGPRYADVVASGRSAGRGTPPSSPVAPSPPAAPTPRPSAPPSAPSRQRTPSPVQVLRTRSALAATSRAAAALAGPPACGALSPPAVTRSAPHSPGPHRMELEAPWPRLRSSASELRAVPRRSYAEVARPH